MMKISMGKVTVVTNEYDYGMDYIEPEKTIEFAVRTDEINGRNFAYVWNVTPGQYQCDPPYGTTCLLDADFSTPESVEQIFYSITRAYNEGIKSITWTEELAPICEIATVPAI